MQDIQNGLGLKRLSLSDPQDQEAGKATILEGSSTTRAMLTPLGWAQVVFTLEQVGGIIESAVENTELVSEEFSTGDGLIWAIVVRPMSLGEEQFGVFLRLISEIDSDTTQAISYSLRLAAVSPDFSVTSEAKFSEKSLFSSSCLESGHSAALLHSHCKSTDSLLIAVILRSLPSAVRTRARTGCVGLVNEGTTCYVNSLLQTFYFIGAFRKAVYQMGIEGDEKDDMPLALQRVFYSLQYSPAAVSTSALLLSFGWGQSERNTQYDVQEFNCTLSAKLERKMKGTVAEGTFSRLFEGVMVNYIRCTSVDFASTTEERFLDLQLSVKGLSGLIDSFNKYTEQEFLVGENQYEAGKYGKQDAIKGVMFKQLPPVLQLQLKRFEFSHTDQEMTKINDKFEFPVNLDLNFCVEQPGDYEYTLFSILVHTGSGDKGHYFAFIRPECGGWVRFDDEKVDKVSEKFALLSSYGGDYQEFELAEGKMREIPHPSDMSAYMLVYVQSSKIQAIVQNLVLEADICTPLHARFGEELRSAEQEKQRKVRESQECTVYFTCFAMLKGWDKAGLAVDSSFPSAKLVLLRKQSVQELVEEWKSRLAVNYVKMWVFSPGLTGWGFQEVRGEEEVGTALASTSEGKFRVVYIDTPVEASLFVQGNEGSWQLNARETADKDAGSEAGLPVFLKWYQDSSLELLSVLSLTSPVCMDDLRARFCLSKGLNSPPLNLYIERCAPDSRNKHMICFPPSTNSELVPRTKGSRALFLSPGDCIICEIASACSLSAKAFLAQFQDNVKITAVHHDTQSSLMTTSYGKRFFREIYRDQKVEINCKLSCTFQEAKEAIATELRLFDSNVTWDRIVLFAAKQGCEDMVEVEGTGCVRTIVAGRGCLYFDLCEFPVKEMKGNLLTQVLYLDQNHHIKSQFDLLLSPKATIATLKSASKAKLDAILNSDSTVSKRNPPVQVFLMQAVTRHYICQLTDSAKVKNILENRKWQLVLRADLEPGLPFYRVFCYSAARSFFIYVTVRPR